MAFHGNRTLSLLSPGLGNRWPAKPSQGPLGGEQSVSGNMRLLGETAYFMLDNNLMDPLCIRSWKAAPQSAPL